LAPRVQVFFRLCVAFGLTLLALTAQAQVVDPPPTLNIISPLNDTVARPIVHVVAQCEDNDPRGCVEITARAVTLGCSFTPLTVPGSSIDDYLGTCGDIEISGKDHAGQVTTVRRPIVIESTPTLQEFESVAGRIIDVAADRILFLQETSTGAGVLKVHDRVLASTQLCRSPAARQLCRRYRLDSCRLTASSTSSSIPRFSLTR